MMRRQKVLVVEDDPALLREHATVLAGEGYQVLEASTCADALRLARAESPDLILLDAALPDGDGVGVCQKIKAHEGLRGTFVVMLSARDTTAEHQAEALNAGADGYLAKPVESVALNSLAKLRILSACASVKKCSRLAIRICVSTSRNDP